MGGSEDNFLWWQQAVIYQVYPRSFYDSNNDGIGDIRGIIEKLDYLEYLGIDAIWLSPINNSPMDDFGYDIRDYRSIHSIFGTQHDFDILIEECHHRGIKVILDLVINHTSDLHVWFLESRISVDSRKRDWYIWHPGKGKKHRVPNNWLSSFGGRAWEMDPHTKQYYLHTFLKEQPDLNWRNMEVQRAVFEEVRHWIERGVDGFRLDVANWYVKDIHLRNNPWKPALTPRIYDWQRHIYDRNRPETHDIIRALRNLLESYRERMAVGEIYSASPGNQRLSASFYGKGDDELHLAFDFSFMYTRWSARKFFRLIWKWYTILPEGSWPVWVFSNHDQPRSIGRFSIFRNSVEKAKVLAMLLLTLRGTPFIYYGEEIGMRNAKLKRRELRDPAGVRFWPFYKGRDKSRTPMQWNDEEYAGFSKHKPWLPVNRDYLENNVEQQQKMPGSLLQFYHFIIKIRKEHVALRHGEWIPILRGRRRVIAYERRHDGESIVVILNFSKSRMRLHEKSFADYRVLYSTHRLKDMHYEDLSLHLYPYEGSMFISQHKSVNKDDAGGKKE